tara:strand:+ start:696 stop:887 length:192 start_codon:yes stop_codon:yes gene_type:complete
MKATTIEERIETRLLEKAIKKSKKMDINMIILGEVIDRYIKEYRYTCTRFISIPLKQKGMIKK